MKSTSCVKRILTVTLILTAASGTGCGMLPGGGGGVPQIPGISGGALPSLGAPTSGGGGPASASSLRDPQLANLMPGGGSPGAPGRGGSPLEGLLANPQLRQALTGALNRPGGVGNNNVIGNSITGSGNQGDGNGNSGNGNGNSGSGSGNGNGSANGSGNTGAGGPSPVPGEGSGTAAPPLT